ncbi:MAG: MFS transporter [Candidatus Nanopelagicales bacterium]
MTAPDEGRPRRIRRAIRRTPLLAGLPREVAVLSAVAFCVALGFGILAPALPVFARSFGVSALEASAVISVFALVRLVTSPLAGALVDRLGERSVLATGLLIVAISSAAAGFSQTYGHLLLLRGLGGLGSSMFSVSAMALLLRVVDSGQRGRAAGAFQGGFLLGGVAGPAVGGLVVAWSIRAPFFVYAITLLAASVVTLAFLARSRLHERELQVSEGQAGRLEQLREALRDRAYRAALGTNLVTGFVVFGMRSSAVPLFVTEGLSRGATLAGIGFLVSAALQALLLLPAGRMADTEGRRKALLIGTSGLTIGMVVLTLSDVAANGLGTAGAAGVVLFLLAMAIQGMAAAFLGSAPAAVVGDVMGGRRGGIVVAAFQMVSDVGAVIGPLAAGYLIDAHDFEWAFAAGAALTALAVILVVVMPETLHRSRRPASA